MKSLYLAAAAAAILASTACSAEKKHSTAGATAAPAVTASVKRPANGDWSQVVSPTQQGGFVMGNPNAKVHLVEFGSLTCPHCQHFNEEGVPTLIADYVKPGKVSYEFRNYVRDPYDITAALIVRCNGAKSFFPLTDAMYKTQPQWIAKLQAVPQDQQQSLENMQPNQEFTTIAKWAGFQAWAATRGIPAAKVTQCLTNQNSVNQLVQMNSDATDQYDIPGTPTFLINGKVVPDAATWDTLKPALDQALGQKS